MGEHLIWASLTGTCVGLAQSWFTPQVASGVVPSQVSRSASRQYPEILLFCVQLKCSGRPCSAMLVDCSRWTGPWAATQPSWLANSAPARRLAMAHRLHSIKCRARAHDAPVGAPASEAADYQPPPTAEPTSALRPVPRAPFFQKKIAQSFDDRWKGLPRRRGVCFMR